MQKHRLTIVSSSIAVMLFACVTANTAAAQKDTEVKGMITTRTGETLIVKCAAGNTTVVLTDNTKTKDERGLLGPDKQFMASTILIPGTKVKVKRTPDHQNKRIAKT